MDRAPERDVTVVVWAGLEGTEMGNAMEDVINGAVNTSGHLPYTVTKYVKDYPAQLVLQVGGDGVERLNFTYSEGWRVYFFSPFFLQIASSPFLTKAYCTSTCRLFVDYCKVGSWAVLVSTVLNPFHLTCATSFDTLPTLV